MARRFKRLAKFYPLIGCLAALVITACGGNSSDSINGLEGELLNDETMAGDEQITEPGIVALKRKLLSRDVEQDLDASWFCSFYSDLEFIARSVLVLDVDDLGALEEQSMEWDIPGESSLSLKGNDWSMIIEDITFSKRANVDDHFEGRVGAEINVACDWSGKPRSEGLFLDDIDPVETNHFAERDPDISSRLLTSLNNGESRSVWFCEMHDSGLMIDTVSYEFYPGNDGFSVFPFKWYPTDDLSVRLVFGENQYDLYDFRFYGDRFGKFSVDDSRGYELKCERS